LRGRTRGISTRFLCLIKRDVFVLPTRKHRSLEVQQTLYTEVLRLRQKSLTYSRIIAEIELRHGVKIPKSNISDWVNSKHMPTGRTNSFQPTRSPELAYIIGVETGDGSLNFKQYNYRIRLKAIDRDFVEEFDRCLSRVLNTARHKLWKGERENEFQLEVSSYLLYKFLRRPLRDLKPWFEDDSECVSAFLRGFFDSEGCVSEGALTAYNTNLELLRYVQWLLLKHFGIATTGPRLGKKKGLC
jgi:DNA endonuclease